MAMKPADIEIHIDHLTLDSGVDVDSARLGADIQRELARLRTNGGAASPPDSGSSVAERIAQAVNGRIQE